MNKTEFIRLKTGLDIRDLRPANWNARCVMPVALSDWQTTGCTSTANAVPDAVNWVAANRVTPVKDQGNCGCCWIFASISAIESASAIHTGQLYSLSEEQVGRISSIM